jgi:hypothetical protein
MTVFGMSDRGKFRAIDLDTEDGQGIQVSIGDVQDPIGGSSIVTSFSADQRENFSVAQCLNGGMYLYAFGHDPAASTFGLGVTLFLRSCNGANGNDLADALSTYNGGRVSKTKRLSTLSVGDAALRGYLVGQSVAVSNNGLGTVSVNYTFVALSPQGQGV